ncbi:hypothetical protein FJ208_02765, partial [Candidatus Gribaldobacteria bacterium]|nr:hypothetical protein [Candidatus Gribaldobacteria bacterium]
MKILLFNAPFLRFAGSHNDRMALSLSYFSRFLEQAKIEHLVYNGDYTGSKTYWAWKWMFDNFDNLKMAVDNQGS